MKTMMIGVSLAACLPMGIFAGTFTWTGGGATFSTCFDAVPPAGDTSVVLDFTGAPANWSVTNDIAGLKVNKIVLSANKGEIAGDNVLTFADNDGTPPEIKAKAVGDVIRCPIVLDGDLTVSHLNGARLDLFGLVSGTKRLIARMDPASTTSTQPLLYLQHKDNTFSGGVVVSAVACYALPGAFGTGNLWSTNTYTTTVGGTTVRSELHQYAPATIPGDVYLEKEDYNGWSHHFVVERDATDGAVEITGRVYSNKTKLYVAGVRCPLRLKGGLTSNNNTIFVCSSAPAYIDSPVDGTAPAIWSGNSAHPVVFNCTGNKVAGFCGWGNAGFRMDVDNAFVTPYPNFAPQNTSSKPFIFIDLNGTTQQLGGNQEVAGVGMDATWKMVIKNSSAETANVTINQSVNNMASALVFEGNPIAVTKAGAGALILTNTVHTKLAVTVSEGMLGVRKGTVKQLSAEPFVEGGVSRLRGVSGLYLGSSVTLAGGTLDLGGGDWVTEAATYAGGRLENGTLKDLSGAVSTSGGTIPRIVTDLEKTGSGTLSVGSVASSVSLSTGFRLPAGTIAYYPFNDAATLLADYAGTNSLVQEVAASPATFDANGATNGCAYFGGNSAFTLSRIPEHLMKTNSYTISWWVKFEYDAFRESIRNRNTEWGMVGFGDKTGSDTGNQQTWACFTLKNTAGSGGPFPEEELYYRAGFYTYGGARYSMIPFTTTSWNVVTNGDWHLMTVTCELTGETTATRTWYLDGVQRSQATGSYSYTVPNAKNPVFYFGRGMWGDRHRGWLDELLILDHAMSAADVAALYQVRAPEYVPATTRPIAIDVQGGTLQTQDTPCLALYHFDDAENLGADSSGFGINLVKDGSGTMSYAAGVSPFGTGGSVYLDGAVTLKASSYPSRFPSGHVPFTFGCYARFDTDNLAATGGEHGWMHLGSSGKYKGISMTLRNDGHSGIVYWNDYNLYPDFGTTLTNGNWHLLVTTFDGRTLKFYYDGALKTYLAASDELLALLDLTPGNFFIGKAMNGYCFRGWIDEAAVIGRALSLEEIQAWQESGLEGISNAFFPSDAELSVSAGATVDVFSRNENLASIDLAGTLTAASLTLTGLWDFTGTLNGDLVLADGVRVEPGTPAPAINGKVTVMGGGTLAPAVTPQTLPVTYTLATGVTSLVGGDHFKNWTVEGLTAGQYKIRPNLVDGVLTLTIRPLGMVLIFR